MFACSFSWLALTKRQPHRAVVREKKSTKKDRNMKTRGLLAVPLEHLALVFGLLISGALSVVLGNGLIDTFMTSKPRNILRAQNILVVSFIFITPPKTWQYLNDVFIIIILVLVLVSSNYESVGFIASQ